MRLEAILLFACGWLAGCGQSGFDLVTNGGGCNVDDNLTGTRGRCPNEQLACELGSFDRDGNSANGCEGTLQPSTEYSLFKLHPDGVAPMSINGYPFTNDTTNG